jgi:hypothetical protein
MARKFVSIDSEINALIDCLALARSTHSNQISKISEIVLDLCAIDPPNIHKPVLTTSQKWELAGSMLYALDHVCTMAADDDTKLFLGKMALDENIPKALMFDLQRQIAFCGISVCESKSKSSALYPVDELDEYAELSRPIQNMQLISHNSFGSNRWEEILAPTYQYPQFEYETAEV